MAGQYYYDPRPFYGLNNYSGLMPLDELFYGRYEPTVPYWMDQRMAPCDDSYYAGLKQLPLTRRLVPEVRDDLYADTMYKRPYQHQYLSAGAPSQYPGSEQRRGQYAHDDTWVMAKSQGNIMPGGGYGQPQGTLMRERSAPEQYYMRQMDNDVPMTMPQMQSMLMQQSSRNGTSDGQYNQTNNRSVYNGNNGGDQQYMNTNSNHSLSNHGNNGNQYGSNGNQYGSNGNHGSNGNQYGSNGNQYGSNGNHGSNGNQYGSNGNQYGSNGNQVGSNGNNSNQYGSNGSYGGKQMSMSGNQASNGRNGYEQSGKAQGYGAKGVQAKGNQGGGMKQVRFGSDDSSDDDEDDDEDGGTNSKWATKNFIKQGSGHQSGYTQKGETQQLLQGKGSKGDSQSGYGYGSSSKSKSGGSKSGKSSGSSQQSYGFDSGKKSHSKTSQKLYRDDDSSDEDEGYNFSKKGSKHGQLLQSTPKMQHGGYGHGGQEISRGGDVYQNYGQQVKQSQYGSMSQSKCVELKVPICCDNCESKVRAALEYMAGVESVLCDQWNKKVTVFGNVKAESVLKRVRRVKKNSELWQQIKRYV